MQYILKLTKGSIAILMFFLQIIGIQAQQNPLYFYRWNAATNTYGARTAYPETAFADDFGPRNTGDDWHAGADFNIFGSYRYRIFGISQATTAN